MSTNSKLSDSSDAYKDLNYYLPLEIIQGIVSYLDHSSLLTLSRTSRYYYRLCHDDHIWLHRFAQDFHTPSARISLQRNHMALYRNHHTLTQRWLDGQVATQYLHGHQDSVYCLARLGPHHIISGSRDRTLKIWQFRTEQQQKRDVVDGAGNKKKADPVKVITTKKTAHEGSVLCLRVSNDNTTMLSGSSDATCILWCLRTMEPLQTLRGHSHGVLDVCMVGDRYYVSASRDHTLCVWNAQPLPSSAEGLSGLQHGKVVYRLLGHLGPVNALDAYGDDHVVSASGDGTLMLWNIRSGECVRTFKDINNNEDAEEATNHQGLACVKCDTKRGLLYSGGQNGKLKIWDVASGLCLATLTGHHGLIRTMDLMEDGNILVTGSYDKTIRVWDLKKRCCRLSFQSGHSSWIFNLLVSRSRIISAGQDKQIMMLDFGKGLSILDD
ncbi:unnamed protein product [Absidia cylindrospora]